MPAIARFCRELAASGLLVRFDHDNVPCAVPGTSVVSLSHRAGSAPECDHHSGSARAEILLTGGEHELHLHIADPGAGFVPENRTRRGLGLISMRERVNSLGGKIAIHASPGRGTRIGVNLHWQPPAGEMRTA